MLGPTNKMALRLTTVTTHKSQMYIYLCFIIYLLGVFMVMPAIAYV